MNRKVVDRLKIELYTALNGMDVEDMSEIDADLTYTLSQDPAVQDRLCIANCRCLFNTDGDLKWKKEDCPEHGG